MELTHALAGMSIQVHKKEYCSFPYHGARGEGACTKAEKKNCIAMSMDGKGKRASASLLDTISIDEHNVYPIAIGSTCARLCEMQRQTMRVLAAAQQMEHGNITVL